MSKGEEHSTGKSALLPGTILAVCIAALGLGAEWVNTYIYQAVDVMMNPALYIKAVFSQINP